MVYAIWQDVAADLGRPASEVSAEEQEQWARWIDRVSGRIARRISDLNDRVAADPDYASTLTGVIVDVVVRRVNNPNGFRSERVDDYYYDRQQGEPSSLWLTDDEWRELGWFASSEAFSTRPGFEPDCVPVWPLWV